MQFFVHSPGGDGHPPFNPGPEVMAEMGKYMEAAVKKGIIPGFTLIQVPGREEALEWVTGS